MKKKATASAVAGAFGQAAPAAPAAAPAAQDNRPIDVEPIIAKAREGLPPKWHDIFDKAVLSGMRVMFDKSSHEMAMAELDKPGPMAKKLSDGIIQLMYILWTQSNQTLPPQIIVPVTLVLTLRAFQFLQESKDPEATTQLLGEATADAVNGVMERFGATHETIAGLGKGTAPSAAQPAAQPAGGMLSAAKGN